MKPPVSKRKTLILHPEDGLQSFASRGQYDRIVDLGRASDATYEGWGQHLGCEVVGIHEFADQNEDLHVIRSLLRMGIGRLTDRSGVDWWSVLSPWVVPQLSQLILIQRLAKYMGHEEGEVYSSRPDYRSVALGRLLGGRLINLETSFQKATRRVRHYSGVAAKFNSGQIFQIAQDKYDREHAIRRRFAKRPQTISGPLILLPSAYINVSRTALSYARLLPDDQFMLVCARDSARVPDLPANVQMISLDSYFASPNSSEISSLLEAWDRLKSYLVRSAPEHQSAAAAGTFDRMPSLIRWGITIRDAWKRLFEAHDFRSCLSADHNNPYTRIPLLLAKRAGIPAVACHHGALDATLALTTHDADFYVAKTEMERDYMKEVCGVPPEKILSAAPASLAEPHSRPSGSSEKRWLVFFSEPYGISGWRVDEVYGELLPHLYSLAETCGLKLVFKLHPFETAKSHHRLLLRHLSEEKVRQIEIITGPIPQELWQRTHFALTVESSVAVECSERGIPVFLCGWLRDSFSGYVQQFQRFRVGQILATAAQIEDIPRLLRLSPLRSGEARNQSNPNDVETLREALGITHSLPLAARG
ncbi:MAG: hypothetical protein ACRD2U_10145 [Terriglobales bacterium]